MLAFSSFLNSLLIECKLTLSKQIGNFRIILNHYSSSFQYALERVNSSSRFPSSCLQLWGVTLEPFHALTLLGLTTTPCFADNTTLSKIAFICFISKSTEPHEQGGRFLWSLLSPCWRSNFLFNLHPQNFKEKGKISK